MCFPIYLFLFTELIGVLFGKVQIPLYMTELQKQ